MYNHRNKRLPPSVEDRNPGSSSNYGTGWFIKQVKDFECYKIGEVLVSAHRHGNHLRLAIRAPKEIKIEQVRPLNTGGNGNDGDEDR